MIQHADTILDKVQHMLLKEMVMIGYKNRRKIIRKAAAALSVILVFTFGFGAAAAFAEEMIAVPAPGIEEEMIDVPAPGIDPPEAKPVATASQILQQQAKASDMVSVDAPGITQQTAKPTSVSALATASSSASASAASNTSKSATSSTSGGSSVGAASANASSSQSATGSNTSGNSVEKEYLLSLVNFSDAKNYYGFSNHLNEKVWWSGTEEGKRFHRLEECSGNHPVQITIKEAVDKRSLSPCKVCFKKR